MVNIKDEAKNYEMIKWEKWEKAVDPNAGHSNDTEEEFKAEIHHDSHEPSDASTNTSIRSEGEPEKNAQNPEEKVTDSQEGADPNAKKAS